MLQEHPLNQILVSHLFLGFVGKKEEMIFLYTHFCTKLSLAACGGWNNY